MGWIKFISGDGVEHEVEETSAAAEVMRNAGFQRVYADQDALKQNDGEDAAAKKPVDLKKLNKAELVAVAEGLELDVVPDSMTKVRIIEAIEAKLAEAAESEAK